MEWQKSWRSNAAVAEAERMIMLKALDFKFKFKLNYRYPTRHDIESIYQNRGGQFENIAGRYSFKICETEIAKL